jgi:hypothetical protein
MTDPSGLFEAALTTKLEGGTALITALGGTSIWKGVAPKSQALPYLVFNHQAGGDRNLTPRRQRDPVYQIKAVAANDTDALAIMGEVDALLHEQTLTISGWASIQILRIEDVKFVELDDAGEFIYHEGGLFRFKTNKSN